MINETRAELMAELAAQGIRHTEKKIVGIARNPEGKIIFLEEGNSRAGLRHIVQAHGSQFVNQGILIAQLPDLLMKAVQQNKVVGTQGRNRPVFSVNFQERTLLVAIQISTNGFIVGANPRSGG